MDDPILKIHKLIYDFENELLKIRANWKKIEVDNPDFDQVSEENWQKRQDRMWLHAATDIRKCNELERSLHSDLPSTKIAQSSALSLYRAWRRWLRIAGIPKFAFCYIYDKKTRSYQKSESKEPSDTYYADDHKFDIEKPSKDEKLFDFLLRLAFFIEDNGKGHRLEWRAFKSFLDFLRRTYPDEQVAFIEHIFPYKMGLYDGKITRLISPEAYPIPETEAAKILIEFARRSCSGRPDAQQTAIESLALCWLCIAASRIPLPKTLERIRNIKSTAVLSGAEFSISRTTTYGGNKFWRLLVDSDFSVLIVSILFGEQPLKISNRLCVFLKAVAHLPSKQPRKTILQKTRRSLTRMFDKVLKSVSPNPRYGNITYLSLLNQPHIFGDHRCQPNHSKTNT